LIYIARMIRFNNLNFFRFQDLSSRIQPAIDENDSLFNESNDLDLNRMSLDAGKQNVHNAKTSTLNGHASSGAKAMNGQINYALTSDSENSSQARKPTNGFGEIKSSSPMAKVNNANNHTNGLGSRLSSNKV